MSFFTDLYSTTGLPILFKDPTLLVQTLIMYVIIGVLFYLAIVRKFEPLLLLPIAFGMLLANLPGANLFHMDLFIHEDGSPINIQTIVEQGNLIDFLYLGVKLGIYPSLIFLGVGAMTDFSALIANPKSLLLGAAAQLGVFVAFIGAVFLGFTPAEAAAIGIIGGADGAYSYSCNKEPRTSPSRSDRYCRLLIHGAHPDHPASVHETPYHKEGTRGCYDHSPSRFSEGKNSIPDHGCACRKYLRTRRRSPYRIPHVRQSSQRQRSYRPSFKDCSERAYEHRNHLPRRVCRSYS